MHKATGEAYFLNYAKQTYTDKGFKWNTDLLTWDSKSAGVKVLLAQITNEAQYLTDVKSLCKFYMDTKRSPKGLAFFSEWGSLKQAASAAFVCLVVI